MSAADTPDHPIRRTGQGQHVETHTGAPYHSFLMGHGGSGHGSFTGGFVGMVAVDITGQRREARFMRFSYDPT